MARAGHLWILLRPDFGSWRTLEILPVSLVDLVDLASDCLGQPKWSFSSSLRELPELLHGKRLRVLFSFVDGRRRIFGVASPSLHPCKRHEKVKLLPPETPQTQHRERFFPSSYLVIGSSMSSFCRELKPHIDTSSGVLQKLSLRKTTVYSRGGWWPVPACTCSFQNNLACFYRSSPTLMFDRAVVWRLQCLPTSLGESLTALSLHRGSTRSMYLLEE
jgi:hypothetical protein